MISCDTGSTEIIHLDHIEISTEPFSWVFAALRRAEINEHFASLKRKRSAIWNGRVLLLKHFSIRDGTLFGFVFKPTMRASLLGTIGIVLTQRSTTFLQWQRCAPPMEPT
jgi:hypothetical protein